MTSSVCVATVTMGVCGPVGGPGVFILLLLATLRNTSTTMGSLAALNASTASSWLDLDRSRPLT